MIGCSRPVKRCAATGGFPTRAGAGQVLARGVTDGPDENFEKLLWTLLGALSIARHSDPDHDALFSRKYLKSAATSLRPIFLDILHRWAQRRRLSLESLPTGRRCRCRW